jgi:hypothetical protein
MMAIASGGSGSGGVAGDGKEGVTLRAEGATMLPVGSKWLTLALACVSRLDPRVVRNFKDGCTLTSKEVRVL